MLIEQIKCCIKLCSLGIKTAKERQDDVKANKEKITKSDQNIKIKLKSFKQKDKNL